MEFTKENWENAPEGARLESRANATWIPVHFVGWSANGTPVIQSGSIFQINQEQLRITLPKRKVTVQLWRTCEGGFWAGTFETYQPMPSGWTFLAEHTFEVEGE